ncbi:hypothetical protein [Bosea sp. (in: a-proteobacteria)]|jgi:hypothetical protein|uniref:hypothetical protein n=1 Tax=Bosea sp. (in: a-proteobacteria) TaxID=1871050 RepID=UPI003F6F0963
MISLLRTIVELLVVMTFSVWLAIYSSLGVSTASGSKGWQMVGLLVAVSLPLFYGVLRVAIWRLSRKRVGDKPRKG